MFWIQILEVGLTANRDASKKAIQSLELPLAGFRGCHYLFASSLRIASADSSENADFEVLVIKYDHRKKSVTQLDMNRQPRLPCWARQTKGLQTEMPRGDW